jgi:MYXO-CTERM domain-containing protein
MKYPSSLLFCIAATAALGLAPSAALGANPANPILFVTQVPMPEEVNSRTVLQSYESCVSPFGNHLGDTAHAGRGGSLHVRFTNGQVVDLLAVADWSGIAGGKPAAGTIATRNPSVSWAADKAIFSMVIGAPSGPTDTTVFVWQLYEITLPTQAQLNANVKPVLSKVANQPPYNNVFPAYGLGGHVVFASDRPYNGQAHLQQREEYLGLPTVSGLWSLDPASASSLLLLHHAPSGAFSPTVDSAGRLIFTSWDHLSRDSEAVTDSRAGIVAAPYSETFVQTFNGSGNFADESAGAAFTQVTAMASNAWESFPEPRNFDRKSLIDDFGNNLNGNAQNIFMPWMINLDGTNGEMLNHVGRHEVAGGFTKSFKNDPAIVDLSPMVNPGYGGMAVRTYYNNLLWTREDPLKPGTFYGSDAADLGTHGAGQIVRLNNAGTKADGTPLNPDGITVTYITPGTTGPKPGFIPTVKPSINLPATGQTALTAANAENLYRTPVPLADGSLIASHVGNVTQTDYNVGTVAQPASLYTMRLKSLKPSGVTSVPDVTLTAGITLTSSYYVGATLVSYSGPAWELDPAEIAPRAQPTPAAYDIDPIEAGVFATVGVHVPTFQTYLRAKNAALSVSRDVTKRDLHDRQQPFNLKITWSNKQTIGTAGTVYGVGWIQFLQADARRGYLLGGATPAAGRRVVPTPLHDTMAENVPTPGAPPGAVRLGDDGSFAAILPAGKAMTWHLLDDDAAKTSQVKERFWLTFQSGEIRTCANCHGINTSDQTGTAMSPVGKPTNPPAALAALLTYWKTNHPAGAVEYTAATASALKSAGTALLDISRVGGSTGPVTVQITTADGTAKAGVDYTATSTTASWADGDTAMKTIAVPLLNAPGLGPKTLTATLSNPTFGALGAIQTETLTLLDDPQGSSSAGSGMSGAGGSGGSATTGGMGGATTGATSSATSSATTGATTGATTTSSGSVTASGASGSGAGGSDTGAGAGDTSGCACSAAGSSEPSSETGAAFAVLLALGVASRRKARPARR